MLYVVLTLVAAARLIDFTCVVAERTDHDSPPKMIAMSMRAAFSCVGNRSQHWSLRQSRPSRHTNPA